MKKQLPGWVVLCIIALVAGLLLGVTNEMTKDRIAAQAESGAIAARKTVLPEAEDFVEQELLEGAPVDNCFAGISSGETVGYATTVTIVGFGGEIEVVVGIGMDGAIRAITVGGESFAETAGLGEKAKDAAFTGQFAGLLPPAEIGVNIDAIAGATITSNAVVTAVNKAYDYLSTLIFGEEEVTDESLEELVDEWSETANGLSITASGRGFGGKVIVTVEVVDGAIASIVIDAPDETPGIGDQVTKDKFMDQFIGKSGELSFGTDVDSVSGATFSSEGALSAINDALKFAASKQ